MYIFSRTAKIVGAKAAEATSFAVDIAGEVKSITGVNVNVYQVAFGAPMGTIVWSARFDTQAALAANSGTLAANASYVAKTAAAAELFEGDFVDRLNLVVSSSLAAPKSVVQATQATILGGRYAQGYELGVKFQETVARVTGQTTAFVAAQYAAVGGVGWLAAADSVGELEEGQGKLNTDPGWNELITHVGEVYAAGTGQSMLMMKIN